MEYLILEVQEIESDYIDWVVVRRGQVVVHVLELFYLCVNAIEFDFYIGKDQHYFPKISPDSIKRHSILTIHNLLYIVWMRSELYKNNVVIDENRLNVWTVVYNVVQNNVK